MGESKSKPFIPKKSEQSRELVTVFLCIETCRSSTKKQPVTARPEVCYMATHTLLASNFVRH